MDALHLHTTKKPAAAVDYRTLAHALAVTAIPAVRHARYGTHVHHALAHAHAIERGEAEAARAVVARYLAMHPEQLKEHMLRPPPMELVGSPVIVDAAMQTTLWLPSPRTVDMLRDVDPAQLREARGIHP